MTLPREVYLLPRDFQKLLSCNPQVDAIVADMRQAKNQRDVESFLEFASSRVASLSAKDREELIEQAHKDARRIKANRNFGTEREGWSKR